MFAWFFVVLSIFVIFPGCSRFHHVSREGVLSQELPLTIDDLTEIRNGEENHQKVLWQHKLYSSPKLETYLNAITASIAEVSTRPHLPYRVFILDEEEVNIFGGPGGYIYMTRGLLDFVQSESEIAGVLAHEIGHISHFDYANLPQYEKVKLLYKGLLKGSELAKNSIGTYGTAAYYGIKGLGQTTPQIFRRFAPDAEIEADTHAVDYLLKAGYDPRGFQQFVERLARVKMGHVGRFVLLMNTHPPFPERREVLNERIKDINFETGKIEFRQDMLSEIRRTTVNSPESIRFEPELGVRRVDPIEMNQIQRDKEEKLVPVRKRWEWL